MLVKFLDLSQIHHQISIDAHEVLSEVVRTNSFIGGDFVRRFEESFASYIGVKYCVGVGNGTDALEIAIEGLDFEAGRRQVIVPANTFIACGEAVTRCGLEPVFCDVGEDYTIDPQACEQLISSKTAAIMCVHLYGQPCNFDAIKRLAKIHNLKIIEDCSQAHGAEYKGSKVGSLGDVACFSFYPGKNLGAFGDGGAVLTNSSALARRTRLIANHGRFEKYDHVMEGRNSRLDNFQAGILLTKLSRLDSHNEIRRRAAATYLAELRGVSSIVLPQINNVSNPSWHLFVIRYPERDKLKKALLDSGIETSIHYPKALTQLDMYNGIAFENRPRFAESTSGHLLSLPMGPHLTTDQVHLVCDAVKKHTS